LSWFLLFGSVPMLFARRDPRALAARAGVLAAGLLVAVAAQAWARTQPLAFGALRTPAEARAPGPATALAGGVVDIAPIVRIEAVLDDGSRVPLATAPDDALVAMFPVADPAQARSFTGRLDLAPAGAARRVRFVATNAHGAATAFDRRALAHDP
jgi:hypothetical protein